LLRTLSAAITGHWICEQTHLQLKREASLSTSASMSIARRGGGNADPAAGPATLAEPPRLRRASLNRLFSHLAATI
jgi:hypothetical protein